MFANVGAAFEHFRKNVGKSLENNQKCYNVIMNDNSTWLFSDMEYRFSLVHCVTRFWDVIFNYTSYLSCARAQTTTLFKTPFTGKKNRSKTM